MKEENIFFGYLNSELRNPRNYCLYLFFVVFGTYGSSIIFGDFINLDDIDVISRLQNTPLVIKDLFFPSGAVKYYRPMVELSYRLDHALWSDVPFGYHLTNVTLHLLNTYFVYIIAHLILSKVKTGTDTAAFLSAVFFAINPLTTESVCWVSGRSDLIASAFMLPSFILYLLFKKKGKHLYLVPSGLLFMLAAMTKEVSLALPVLIIAIEILYSELFSEKRDWRVSFLVSGYFVVLTALYLFFFRGGGATAGNPINIADSGVGASYFDSITIILASIGFYFKKLFFPYPLNLIIHGINMPPYLLLGVTVISAYCIFGMMHRNMMSFIVAWVLITVSPAGAAAALGIPTVPWAERYLYVPLVGFSLGLGMGIGKLEKGHRKAAILIVTLVVFIFLPGTLYRTYLWADEVRLWEDTVKKTDSGRVYYFYGKALIDKGRKEEGMRQLKKSVPFLERVIKLAPESKDAVAASQLLQEMRKY